jgi:hypothetical protein
MAEEIKTPDVKPAPKSEVKDKLPYTPVTGLSASITGRGNQLGYSNTSGGTIVPIAELYDSNLPKVTNGKVDSTNYLSGGVEYKPNGWPEIGDQTFKVRYTKAQAVTLYALVQSGTIVYWTATLPDGTTSGTTYTFAGFVSSVGGDPIPNKDLIGNTIVVTGTGAMTVTPGT